MYNRDYIKITENTHLYKLMYKISKDAILSYFKFWIFFHQKVHTGKGYRGPFGKYLPYYKGHRATLNLDLESGLSFLRSDHGRRSLPIQ